MHVEQACEVYAIRILRSSRVAVSCRQLAVELASYHDKCSYFTTPNFCRADSWQEKRLSADGRDDMPHRDCAV